jgi:hypothetical protein
MSKGDTIVGYDPVDGRLIAGKHQDHRGNWVDAFYVGDDIMIGRSTELDRAVFGENIELTIVVWRSEWAATERYRLATDVSYHCAASEDLEREDEMLSAAAAARFDPDEDDEGAQDTQIRWG